MVEIFGDKGVIEIAEQQVALITLTKTLSLLDLRGTAAMKAGTLAAISSVTQRNISQAWGRYFYDNLQLYKTVDGLIYLNAHNGEEAIALYERAKSSLNLALVEVLNLVSPALRDSILTIAARHNMIVQF